jgi:hypothetical protein
VNKLFDRLFDSHDLADWELGFEAGRAALDIPALRGCMPEYMRIEVLEVEPWER